MLIEQKKKYNGKGKHEKKGAEKEAKTRDNYHIPDYECGYVWINAIFNKPPAGKGKRHGNNASFKDN